MSDNLEYCFECDEPTGCAGRNDDSHYNEDGEGPFCWRCWCEDENPRLHEALDAEQEKNKRLREALEMAQQLIEWAESKCHLNCADGYVPMMPDGDPEPCQWCVTKKAAEQALKEKP